MVQLEVAVSSCPSHGRLSAMAEVLLKELFDIESARIEEKRVKESTFAIDGFDDRQV